jgi:hypothetical protein
MTDLSTLQVPGPIYEPLNGPFWEGAAKGELNIQHCLACKRHVFYPRPICPHCWVDALTWVQASGNARLKSVCEVHKPGHPGWLPVAPYLVGLAELDEGPTLLSYIVAARNAASVGDRLRFAPTTIGGRILPCFRKDPK